MQWLIIIYIYGVNTFSGKAVVTWVQGICLIMYTFSPWALVCISGKSPGHMLQLIHNAAKLCYFSKIESQGSYIRILQGALYKKPVLTISAICLLMYVVLLCVTLSGYNLFVYPSFLVYIADVSLWFPLICLHKGLCFKLKY